MNQLSAGLALDENPYLQVTSGTGSFFLGQMYAWLASLDRFKEAVEDFESVNGTLTLSSLQLKGPLLRPRDWRFQARGGVYGLAMNIRSFPGLLAVTGGRFEAIPEKLSFMDCQMSFLDASITLSGSVNGYGHGISGVDLMVQGGMGPKATGWTVSKISLPPEIRPRSPLSVSQGRLLWDKGGKTSIAGNLIIPGGPGVSLNMLYNPGKLAINRLLIQDEKSRAALALNLKKQELRLDFDGALSKKTLDRLLLNNRYLNGWIEGNFSAHILMDTPINSSARGKLRGASVVFPWRSEVSLAIEGFSLNATKEKLNVESTDLIWNDRRLTLEGKVVFSNEGPRLDMELSTDDLDWAEVKSIIDKVNQKRSAEPVKKRLVSQLKGVLRVRLRDFRYGDFTWSPLHASVLFDPDDGIDVVITRAELCGISTPGTMEITPQGLQIAVTLAARDQELAPAVACLLDKEGLMSGRFGLPGKLTGQGDGRAEVIKSLQGDLQFVANEGRIYRSGLLAKIFALLNASEVFFGELPDLVEKGFGYKRIKLQGEIQNGLLVVKEGIINGASMEITIQGDINLIDQQVDLRLLVAPFKTVDRMVKYIPMLKGILGGHLVCIPMRVTGKLSDPQLTPLSPAAVGSELLGIMKGTLNLPLQVIQPLF